MTSPRTLVHAAAVVDGAGVSAAPGALLLDGDSVVAAGAPSEIGAVEPAQRVDASRSVVVPGLVNSHCHLDLSHLGPVPYHGSFRRWIDFVRSGRATTPDAVAASVRRGAELAAAGGTVLVGDIAGGGAGSGAAAAVEALRASPLAGVSFVEVFGQGAGAAGAIEAMRRVVDDFEPEAGGVFTGLQPHAPYSCAPEVFRAATSMGCPLATHLAETREELGFVDAAEGPLADLIRELGKWDDTIRGRGCHPIDLLAESLAAAPWVAAHLNYVNDEHLARLARWPVSVAYCPRASAYFGHEGHRYRDMLTAGVTVTLGTDSLVCLETPDRISVLDEMRLLARRDGTDARTLLAMATTAGAEALGFDPGLVSFRPGRVAGVIAVDVDVVPGDDPLAAALRADAAPRWLLAP